MQISKNTDNLYWIWLSLRLGVANASYLSLLEKCGSPFDIYNMNSADFPAIEGVNDTTLAKLDDKNLTEAYKIIDFCSLKNVGILTYGSKNYPTQLRTLRNPPIVLYYRGTIPSFDTNPAIAVVGTRKMSEYGKNSAFKIAYELAAAGTIIVSGMALGIDSVASCGALEANGQTVAVLGCGIDVTYPTQHAKLMELIIQNGAVMTEFAPSTRPMGENFPIRNRIISGLCRGTLVIEADAKSGALITAKNAIIQGREVYALPGNIGESNSDGTNALIRDGAGIILGAEDLLKNLENLYSKTINYTHLRFMQQKYTGPDNALSRYCVSSRTVKVPVTHQKNSPIEETSTLRAHKINHKNNKIAETATTPQKPKTITPPIPDNSTEIISTLSEKNRKIFEQMPLDRAISIEKLTVAGFSVGDVIGAMTVLEIKGLVSSLPGGMYIRK